MSLKKFNISLSHPDSSLDVNNKTDVGNIDKTLALAVATQNDKEKLKELFLRTSFLYLKRLQEDGLIEDLRGPGFVPIHGETIVTQKGFDFFNAGGYTALFKETSLKATSLGSTAINITARDIHLGDKVDRSTFRDFKSNQQAANDGFSGGPPSISSRFWHLISHNPLISGIIAAILGAIIYGLIKHYIER